VSDFRDIVWFLNEKSAISRERLACEKRCIVYRRGIPDFEEKSDGRILVILLDLLNEAYLRVVCDLCTMGSHHRKISVILVTLNLFHQGRFSRYISLNVKYQVVFKNVREKNHFAYLAIQVYPEDSNGIMIVTSALYEKSMGFCFSISQWTVGSLLIPIQ